MIVMPGIFMAELSKSIFREYAPDVARIKKWLRKHKQDENKPRSYFRRWARSFIPSPDRILPVFDKAVHDFKDAVDITTGERLFGRNTQATLDRVRELIDDGRVSGEPLS